MSQVQKRQNFLEVIVLNFFDGCYALELPEKYDKFPYLLCWSAVEISQWTNPIFELKYKWKTSVVNFKVTSALRLRVLR